MSGVVVEWRYVFRHRYRVIRQRLKPLLLTVKWHVFLLFFESHQTPLPQYMPPLVLLLLLIVHLYLTGPESSLLWTKIIIPWCCLVPLLRKLRHMQYRVVTRPWNWVFHVLLLSLRTCIFLNELRIIHSIPRALYWLHSAETLHISWHYLIPFW